MNHNLDYRCIYAIDFGDKVKIGVSVDFDTRLHQHEYNTMTNAKQYYATEPCTNYYELERRIITRFADKAVFGKEWLDAPFNEICTFIKDIYNKYALHGENLIDRNENIASMMDFHQKHLNTLISNMKSATDQKKSYDFLLHAISEYTRIFEQLFYLIEDYARDLNDKAIIDIRDTIYFGGMDDIWLCDEAPDDLKTLYIRQSLERIKSENANYIAAAKNVLDDDDIATLEFDLKRSEEEYAKNLMKKITSSNNIV